jgi:hypothetical protein
MVKINTLQKFFIDNNKNMTNLDLARATGLTTRQVSAYRRKQEGLNRSGKPKDEADNGVTSSPERAEKLIEKSQEAAKQQKLEPVPDRPVPSMRIDALLAKRAGVVALTGPASELADLFDGIGPDSKGAAIPRYDPFGDESRVHKIKK